MGVWCHTLILKLKRPKLRNTLFLQKSQTIASYFYANPKTSDKVTTVHQIPGTITLSQEIGRASCRERVCLYV